MAKSSTTNMKYKQFNWRYYIAHYLLNDLYESKMYYWEWGLQRCFLMHNCHFNTVFYNKQQYRIVKKYSISVDNIIAFIRTKKIEKKRL